MAIEFYCGSGSPYAWRVWLALERKALACEVRMMSFSAGDLKTPEFLALNPRGKVPVLVDGDFVIYESAAILDYLEEAHSNSGEPLLPVDVKARARARRLIREADSYLAHAMESLLDLTLFTPAEQWDAEAITNARDALAVELSRFDNELDVDYFAGEVGAVDFTVYPMIALALRVERKKPDLNVSSAIPLKLSAWMRRMEALPYFTRTYPPHWKLA